MKNNEQFNIGIIGCGNISQIYLKALKYFPFLNLIGVADIHSETAQQRAKQFNLKAYCIEDLLKHSEIQLIINLTPPQFHVEVNKSILQAGKHAYSEKPLGLNTDEAKALLNLENEKKLRVGSAPDTFLGGAHQLCKKIIDQGAIGQVIGGTAHFMCGGHESWHPNPDFYYQKGAGPLFDMGPYYISALVNMLGPITTVSAMNSSLRKTRIIGSEERRGDIIKVEVPTHSNGLLTFANGAIINVIMSFDVLTHKHTPIEIYGTEGTLLVPDPNFFGGDVFIAQHYEQWQKIDHNLPFCDDNYRMLGVAEMAHSILNERQHLANSHFAYHVLEIMEAFEKSSKTAQHIPINSSVNPLDFLSHKFIEVTNA